jgi:hypothetical protein
MSGATFTLRRGGGGADLDGGDGFRRGGPRRLQVPRGTHGTPGEHSSSARSQFAVTAAAS